MNLEFREEFWLETINVRRHKHLDGIRNHEFGCGHQGSVCSLEKRSKIWFLVALQRLDFGKMRN